MISILTPTYNRGYILPKLYESLKRQTMNEFEWIIIDDGSTDNTQDIVSKWIEETSLFNILYLKQKNGGKHRALNKGIPYANYEYIYIIDSDDYITDNAVEKIHQYLSTIENRDEFAGVSGLRGYNSETGIKILGQYPSKFDFIDATNLQRRQMRLLGDKAEVYRRDLLLKYPFPEFEGEKFIGEAVVWDKLAAEGYKMRWFNQVICICEYLEDGLTKSDPEKRKLNNFEGYTYLEKMNVKLSPFIYSKFAIGRYFFLARKKGLGIEQVTNNLEINKINLFLGIFFETFKGCTKFLLRRN